MKVLEMLLAQGWTAADGAAVATKAYRTAVGPREAQAYLSGQLLTAHYWSEGRNATASVAVVLAPTAVETVVARFCADVDALVSKTYAVSLLP